MADSTKTRAAEILEWVLGALSALVVLLIGGYLVREGLSETEAPSLSVAMAAPSGGALPFVVRNDGGRTATSVAVSLTLSRDGAFVGERRLVIDYVPGMSEVEGAFMLSGLEGLDRALAVEGYVHP